MLTLLFLFSVTASAKNYCAPPFTQPVVYEKFLSDKAKRLETFANSRLIASKADDTLSKLLTAKSPVIYSWIDKRGFDTSKDEIKIVKEWRLYFAQNFIIGQYPSQNAEINQAVAQLIDSLYQEYLPTAQRARFDKLFHEAQKLSLERLTQFPLKKENLSAISERISKTKVYWMDKFSGSKYEKQPLEVFSWGIAYDPVVNEINMGLEALAYATDETIFAVFAHEIGHSVDSCRWVAFFSGDNPFAKINSCLRTSDSVGARVRDDSQLSKLDATMALAMKANPTCNKVNYPPSGLQKDQLPESFADWFSAEVVGISSHINEKLRNDLCSDRDLEKGSSYVSNSDRLTKIYFAHPAIQAKLKVNSPAKYCSF